MIQRPGYRRLTSGFTLMEMLLVLVIISLLMTLTPPLFSEAMPRLSLKSKVQDLVSDLNYVRDLSLMKSQPTRLSIDFENNTYTRAADSNPLTTDLPDDLTVSVRQGDVEFSGDGQFDLLFFPDGSTNGGTLSLSNDEQQYLIEVDWFSGRVSMLDADPLK